MYLNKAFIYGNLTRDPELRALPSGGQVASFGVATNRTYKGKDGQKQESTEFHNIVAFGRLAEVIGQYMKKGRPIFIEGRIQTRNWDDKTSGEKKYRTEIVAENFQFGADGGRGAASGSPSATSGSSARGEEPQTAPRDDEAIKYPDEEINPEDIPF